MASKLGQEIWANARGTRDSISLISYTGCLGLSPVYFSKNIKCAHTQPKIAKNSLKTHILGFKVIDVGTPGKLVSSACYDTQRVCVYLQPFFARLVDSSRNRSLWRGCANLMHTGLLEPRGHTLHRWNLRLMPNISCAGCPGLYWMVSALFTLKMCITA